MIAHDCISPEPVLEPKGAVEQRVVLLRGAEFGPDADQALGGAQLGLGHVGVVVPKHPAVQRRPVGCDEDEEQPEEKAGAGER